MKHLLFVFGTRPEAIKLSPLILLAKKRPSFKVTVCVTGQHQEMLFQVLSFFGIEPDYHLSVMSPSQSLSTLTSRILERLDEVFSSEKPDVVLVQGDTTTTFAAALSAFYHRIPVAHIEAGLRSFDKYSPFPEEVNRLLTTRLSTWHFPPTEQSAQFLLKEGIKQSVYVVGNTVVDALLLGTKRVSEIGDEFFLKQFPSVDLSKRLLLVTCHRRENWGKPLEAICEALIRLVNQFSDIQVVFPVHLNPQVSDLVSDKLASYSSRILLLPPLSYDALLWMMTKSYFILTDSGGLQEEAPSLGKPVLVLRRETERQEGIDSGTALLVGTDTVDIVEAATLLLTDEPKYQSMSKAQNPYGDGLSSERILERLSHYG